MRPPELWERRGPPALLLWPASLAWTAAARLRRAAARPRRAPVPVICVGNLVAGGAGKTPMVAALVRRLAGRGRRPHVLSRGYGGRERGPLRVDPARHGARDVGDEPLLLARHAPVWVGADRRQTAALAAAAGADVVVMDDGFQNPALAKDLSLLVVDGAWGFGNGFVLPAGPLREPVGDGLARAQAAVVIGADERGLAARLGATGLPVLAAELRPTGDALTLQDEAVLAFAGIARPSRFFATLERLGAALVETRSFPDHHDYDPEEIMLLVERAHRLGARLVTTEKDWVRLDADARPMVEQVPVEIVLEDPAALDALIAGVLERAR